MVVRGLGCLDEVAQRTLVICTASSVHKDACILIRLFGHNSASSELVGL